MMNKWETVKLGDVLKYEQPTKYIVSSDAYNENFDVPVLTAGKTFLLGHTNERENIFTNIPVIIFDDFTTAIKFVDFPFKVKSSAMKILKSTDKINIKYIYYLMTTIKSDTGLHKRYWISKYADIEIGLPPLDVQKQIADEIDKISRLIENRKEQIDKLDVLVKSRFIEMFGDPVLNPMEWKKQSIDAVCNKIMGGGTPSKSKVEYYEGNIPWVTPKDMKKLYIDSSIDNITNEATESSSAKLVPENSVLMVIRSGILKKTLPVAINTKPVTTNQDMKAFIPNDKVNHIFLLYSFILWEKELLSNVRAVTADNIEFSIIKNLITITPPIVLQNQFADFVAQVDKSKFEIKHSLEKLETLKKALMQEYIG